MSVTIEALESGAYDFISKPQGSSGDESRTILKKQLLAIIRSLVWRQSQDRLRTRKQTRSQAVPLEATPLQAESTTPENEATLVSATAAEPAMSLDTLTTGYKESETLAKGRTNLNKVATELHELPQRVEVTPKPLASPVKTSRLGATSAKTLSPPNETHHRAASKETTRVMARGEGLMPQKANDVSDSRHQHRHAGGAPAGVIKAILIGVSTGGPAALMQLIPKLPAHIGVPIFIVQHMPPKFTESLAHSLDEASVLKVVEGAEGMVAQPNHVYIAPGGYHMTIARGKGRQDTVIHLNSDAPVNSCRPAVDVLFKSASQVYPTQTLSIILTGMGRDGTDGIRHLKGQGSTYTLSQSESSCVVYGMPKATDEEGLSDESVDLTLLPKRICSLLRV
jgi:chemotaxis response regulator CheB